MNTKEGLEAMKIFLAGPHGNVQDIWKEHKHDTKEAMKVFLASPQGWGKYANQDRLQSGDLSYKICVLESFYYIHDWMKPYIRDHWDFLLDSGAFTFMGDNDTDAIDWDAYLTRYINFINEMNIDQFFELDIDAVVGLKRVEELRTRLESETGKKCIPVWHPSRGLDYYYKMVEEYDYVALSLSGKYTSSWIRNSGGLSVINKLLNIAKRQKCKVHGLGYTKLNNLPKLKFYSVDSTAWVYGNRGGYIYQFNGTTIDKINKPKGTKLKSKAVAIHNFKEWVKFQRYALSHL